ncbi:hypothetical protein DTO027B6_3665 [Paecilomyces variotii]|nr:hypothetical protein DTO027B6_3665 [Paecilomyces variotii]
MAGRDGEGAGILSERFFRFRARLPGDSPRVDLGAFSDESDWLVGTELSVRLSVMAFSDDASFGWNGMDEGDSGDELGDVSVTEGESKVETVVVGDESVDSDVTDETLSRCLKGRKCRDVLTVTLDGRRPSVCVPILSSFLPTRRCDIPPKTDMNDGNDAGTDGALVWRGILVRDAERDLRFEGVTLSGLCLSSKGCENMDGWSHPESGRQENVEFATCANDLFRGATSVSVLAYRNISVE